MPDLERESFDSIIKDLAEAFSIHAKYSNRLWTFVILASAVIIFPKIQDNNAKLPFDLAEVPLEIYYPIGFLILRIPITCS